MIVDIEVLSDMTVKKTATIDERGILHLHGTKGDDLDWLETKGLLLLLKRQEPRIETGGSLERLASFLSVYPPFAMVIYERLLKLKATAQVHTLWADITAHPGTLFHCGDDYEKGLYGGLTDDGLKFVFVPSSLFDLYYQQHLIAQIIDIVGPRETDEAIHNLAQSVLGEEYSETPSEIIEDVRSALYQVNFWYDLAKNHRVSPDRDPYDIRRFLPGK